MSNKILYIVASPIGNLEDMNQLGIRYLNEADYIAVEDSRVSLKLLNHLKINKKLLSYHKFNEDKASLKIVELIKQGFKVALLSDAGFPLISDPGYNLVSRCLNEEIKIEISGGANAALYALIKSGFDTYHFLFYGFLNHKETKAKKELEELSKIPYTLIFYESVHRINNSLKLLYEVLGDRKVCVCKELSKLYEEVFHFNLSKHHEYNFTKGEYVIVVSKAEVKNDNTDDFTKQYNELLKLGLSKSMAVKILVKLFNVKKKDLYLYSINED